MTLAKKQELCLEPGILFTWAANAACSHIFTATAVADRDDILKAIFKKNFWWFLYYSECKTFIEVLH